MKSRFEQLRATQAAAILVGMAGGRMDYIRVLKLLYLADRQSLLETGSTITGDRVVNMEYGPVLSTVYDCIKGSPTAPGSWNKFLKTEGYSLTLEKDPGDGELSDYDVRVLKGVFSDHSWESFGDMKDEVHALPEWQDPSPAKVKPLEYEDILRAAGVAQGTIEEYQSLNKSREYMDQVRVIRD